MIDTIIAIVGMGFLGGILAGIIVRGTKSKNDLSQ